MTDTKSRNASLRIKIKKKCENVEGLDLFLNGPNFTRNGIIIPMQLRKGDFFYKLFTRRCIFQLTKYEHKGVSESTEFDDTSFSSVFLAE